MAEIKPGVLVKHKDNPKKTNGRVLKASYFGSEWWVVDWGDCRCHNCESELVVIGAGEEITVQPEASVDAEVERRR